MIMIQANRNDAVKLHRGGIFKTIQCRKLIAMLMALVLCTASDAQDKTTEIDKFFSWSTPTTPGCVCAVSQNGKVVVNRAYGSADLERDVPLSPNSVFDIGSVRKQFVAAAVLLLVEEGRLSLSDDIRKHFPELPDYGHRITVDHLLTHTSGIRDWTGIRPLAEGDPELLTLIFRQRGLNFAPGEEWSYSNSGYVLLTDLVARASGMSFGDFSRKRLFEPLGMKSTVYGEDPLAIIKNRALAYEKEGNNWKLGVLLGKERGKGSGAILSTASDLVIWNDALTSGRLGAFVTEKLHEPATLNNGRKLRYARGLNVENRGVDKLVWHSGGAAGYSTLSVRLPEQKLSVAIVCNVDGGAKSEYTRRIIDLFIPSAALDSTAKASTPAINAGGVNVTASDINGRAGLFFNEQTGQPLRLAANNNTLTIAGSSPLVAVANDRFKNQGGALFFMSEAQFELQFLSADLFEIKTKEGETMRYRRAPKAYTPTADELNTFAGLYESNEMGSVLEVVPEKGGLVMRFYRNPTKALQFKPVDRDLFMLGMMTVRFLRDKNGKVVGYNYSNPVVRNIKFTRMGDAVSSR